MELENLRPVPSFIIQCVSDEGGVRYYAEDRSSEGFGYWTSFWNHARLFPTAHAAMNFTSTDPRFAERDFFGEGLHRAPRMIYSGIGLNVKKTKGTMILSILQIYLGFLDSKSYDQDYGTIPEKYRNPEDIKQSAMEKLTEEEKKALGLI